MRLSILAGGHSPGQKALLALAALAAGGRLPEPIRVLSYRRELFGADFAACVEEALRGSQHWSQGEAELFAAFVSQLNDCKYCAQTHAAVAARGLGDEPLVAAVLADWRAAPLDEKLRAMLGLLEQVTLHPGALGPADMAPLRAAGLGDQAIEEALYVAFVINVMDRLADAFDFDLPAAAELRRYARLAQWLGYGTISLPG